MPSRYQKYKWILLGTLAIALRVPFSVFPESTLHIYQNGFFALYRVLWDHSVALLPFPLIYLGIVAVVIWIIAQIRKPWDIGRSPLWLRLANGLGALVFWFYILWGYNYHAPALADRMDLKQIPAETEELKTFAEWLVDEMQQSRDVAIKGPWVEPQNPDLILAEARSLLEQQLSPYQYPTQGEVRCRRISSSGVMRRMGILGIYMPFVGEGQVDNSVTGLSLYFSATHEMSHGYGITNEGEANFAAWLALTSSSNELLQYLGHLELFRYTIFDLYAMDYDVAERVMSELPSSISNDLQLIRDNSKQYPGYFPKFSEAMNNMYLKAQGVEEGVTSYGEFVNLALAYSTANRYELFCVFKT